MLLNNIVDIDSKTNDETSIYIPPIFVSHGGGPLPLLADKDHKDITKLLKNLSSLIQRPKAILVISAHWEEKEFTLLETPDPKLLFDYYGFPEESYKYSYNAPLAKTVNQRIKDLFLNNGLKINSEKKRGWDHGVFVPLLLAYPSADIPITQISLKYSFDVKEHLNLGKVLSPLCNEGVLILASGFTFHNMNGFFYPTKELQSANKSFDLYLKDSLVNQTYNLLERYELLQNWNKNNIYGKLCHPREEHLIPLFVSVGAANGSKPTFQEFSMGVFDIFNAIFDNQ